METLSSIEVALEQRRQNVADWIEGSLRPVEQLLIETQASNEQTAIVDGFEVRDYQLDSWASVWDARQDGAKSALAHLATGLGKTSVGVFDVIKYREEYEGPRENGPRVLFACHQKEILDQAAERFSSFIPTATQGNFIGQKKDLDSDITFATLQSLQKSLDTIPQDYFDYIIYDEAHHSKADTFENVVKHFNPQFQLALTATPNRMDQLDIRELFGNEVYSKGLAEALAEGLLADVDYHIVFDDAVKEAMESGFEANSLKALAELFDVKARNEVIAKNIKEEMERIGLQDAKTIVFCQSIEHADEMARLLDGEPYHSKLETRQHRSDTLAKFRNGNLQIICTRDMFNEGVDIPDARLIVFLRSTTSQTIFEQQLGRGLRKQEGKDKVSVLDFVANIERILFVQELMNKTRDYSKSKGPNGGDGEPGGIDFSGDDEVGNLLIHTIHGDFDFDVLAVNLLEKFKRFSNNFIRYSNEELIKLALRISPETPLSRRGVDELSRANQFPSSKAISNRFGSLIDFHKACGFTVEYNRPNPETISNEDIINIALEIKPDGPLTVKEINQLSKDGLFVSAGLVKKRFGSVVNLQLACGFDTESRNAKTRVLSDDEIIKMALKIDPETPLGSNRIANLSKDGLFVSTDTLRNRFGSLDAFYVACGFIVEKRTIETVTMSDQEIIDLALSLQPNKPLNKSDIQSLSKQGVFPSTTAISNRFKTIVNFQKACGFDI